MNFHEKWAVFGAFWVSMEFDILRYVLIFLMIFGHKYAVVLSG